MSLAPKPYVRHVRRLAMTPQLRQAIGLLSLDNAALTKALREAAAANPCIGVRVPGASNLVDRLPAAPEGLEAHVARQIDLNIPGATDRQIAYRLLDALEPWGWLGRPIDDIARDGGHDPARVGVVLLRVQEFEPTGIFARGLAECLALQARDQGLLDPVMRQVLENLDLIARGDLEKLAGHCDCDIAALRSRLSALRGFDPKPGLQFATPPPPVAAPDILVTRRRGRWRVQINPGSQPGIEILPGLDAQAFRDAERISASVERRNGTVLAVAQAVVKRQHRFLEGSANPAPLTLVRLAATVGCHPSTISRITAVLTVDTPRGVLPMRALLGRELRGVGEPGNAIAVAELEAQISNLVGNEDPARPLSDAQLTDRLNAAGIGLHRRTVAKYRAKLGIQTAHSRRKAGQNGPGDVDR